MRFSTPAAQTRFFDHTKTKETRSAFVRLFETFASPDLADVVCGSR